MNYHEICLHVLSLDNTIRFAGIASMDGRIFATEYREGIAPLLTRQESELYTMQSLIRMSIRKTLEEKVGKTIYAVTTYQKIKRAAIMLYNKDTTDNLILMVSFDKHANHDPIITEKILPFLQEVGKDIQHG